MKSTQLIFVILVASLAGAALVRFGNSAVVASWPVLQLFALAAGLTLAAFGLYDYSRRFQPLTVRARLLRPTLRSDATSPAADSHASDGAGRSSNRAA